MIKKITLEQFKCFRQPQSFDFSLINLLTGLNGRGKSTVLQPLILLKQSLGPSGSFSGLNLDGDLINLCSFDDVVSAQMKDKYFIIDIDTDDKSDNHLHTKFIPYKGVSTFGQISELSSNMVDYLDIPSENPTQESEGTMQGTAVLGSTSQISVLRQFQGLRYISADRLGPKLSERKQPEFTASSVGVHGENVLKVLWNKGADFREEVRAVLDKVMSGASLDVRENGDDIEVYMDSSVDGNTHFRSLNVGFGYSHVLPIIVTMLMAENNSKVIIENPEAHLHPGAQSELIHFIIKIAREKNIQVFIETHSDHIINGALVDVNMNALPLDDFSIHFIDIEEGTSRRIVKQLEVSPVGKIKRPPKGFFDQIDKDMEFIMGF